MPPRAVLLDTSFILALENRDDFYHERAKLLDRELTQKSCVYVIHWGILLEIADGYARVDRRHKGLRLLERFQSEQGYQVDPIDDVVFRDALHLYRKRVDKAWGLTDCVSFILMEREGISEALTADVHFQQAGFVALLRQP